MRKLEAELPVGAGVTALEDVDEIGADIELAGERFTAE